jgi:demethylmenaquinone methyltransferase/2-methoxy-6-polyprenyl-1,4-benzoquinol methylase
MLASARRRLARESAARKQITFVRGDAEALPFGDGEFDALTFTYLLRYVDDPAETMRELARVVRPGGPIAMAEFGVPDVPLLKALWRAHTRAGLPLLGRIVSPAWYEVGRFLGPSIEEFHAREPDVATVWRAAGIRDVTVHRLSFGAGLVISGVRDGHRPG